MNITFKQFMICLIVAALLLLLGFDPGPGPIQKIKMINDYFDKSEDFKNE